MLEPVQQHTALRPWAGGWPWVAFELLALWSGAGATAGAGVGAAAGPAAALGAAVLPLPAAGLVPACPVLLLPPARLLASAPVVLAMGCWATLWPLGTTGTAASS